VRGDVPRDRACSNLSLRHARSTGISARSTGISARCIGITRVANQRDCAVSELRRFANVSMGLVRN